MTNDISVVSTRLPLYDDLGKAINYFKSYFKGMKGSFEVFEN